MQDKRNKTVIQASCCHTVSRESAGASGAVPAEGAVQNKMTVDDKPDRKQQIETGIHQLVEKYVKCRVLNIEPVS
jgi:hypothetical protein